VLDPRPPRPPRALLLTAAGVTAALALAAPAGATEGPAAAPPIPPWNLSAPTFGSPAPTTTALAGRPAIRSAKIVPRHIRKGKRARLRLLLPQAGRVQYTITRRSRPGRGRMTTRRVSVPAGKVSIRLPRGVKGHALKPGRYRVSVLVVDGTGNRSRTIRRSFVVRPAHR
jgi:hypothetical protein